jgi:hypothetical protein
LGFFLPVSRYGAGSRPHGLNADGAFPPAAARFARRLKTPERTRLSGRQTLPRVARGIKMLHFSLEFFGLAGIGWPRLLLEHA